ncbi:MAG: glucose-6-phosphate isomerase [Clostridia bacterium]|nr:glucose-6-phosphate isomerase [Clostridia bacterium]
MARYDDPSFRQSMRLRLDYNNMMSDMLGERGIQEEEIDGISEQLNQACRALVENRGNMRWRELPYNQNQIVEDIIKAAEEIRKRCEYFVVLGIGGSALGPIAVQQALNHLRYNELPNRKRKGPRFYVLDNIDPETMTALFDVIDPDKTVFNVITKSGGTSETMSQLLIVSDILHSMYGDKISDHLIAVTDESKGNLIKIAKLEGLCTFYVPDGVGGRFSELCPVGLLPAAVCGIDIRELLAGAAYMDEICAEEDVRKNPAYMLGTLSYIAMQRGINIHVMMPYADSLKYISDWFAQLWAESLGKLVHRDGSDAHAGQTPVKALGVTDQHSQVQLYTEGPFDKIITFLGVEKFRSKVAIPLRYEDIHDVSFLSGHSLNELLQTEQHATEYAVMKSGHLSETITLPEVNAFTIGELLYMFEVMTAFTGELLDIDTFNQPGVEEGKNATYAMLGKPGYDEKRAELESQPAKNEKYILA